MCPLRALLAERVLSGLGLPLPHGERRERGTALLLLVVLRLRLLLLLVAAHLTFGHDASPLPTRMAEEFKRRAPPVASRDGCSRCEARSPSAGGLDRMGRAAMSAHDFFTAACRYY